MKNLKVILCAMLSAMLFAGAVGCAQKTEDPPEECKHESLTKIDGKDSTCVETGNYTYYECECGKLFSDKDAKKPTTLDDVTIEKLPHATHHYIEQIGKYEGYYLCELCGRYYNDAAGKREIPYDELVDSTVTPVYVGDGWTDPDAANAENRNFTLRAFIGWTDGTENGMAAYPDDGRVVCNVNLNRKCTLQNDGWYSFGISFDRAFGLRYKDFEKGDYDLKKFDPKYTALFLEQGGIWVRVVRDGTECSFYVEDKYGIPIYVSSNDHFDENESLIRLAFNCPAALTIDGWSLMPRKAEICWGIANHRCAFTQKL